jgi:anti-sigma28 factor (negative regulator of flagellin synthesis)
MKTPKRPPDAQRPDRSNSGGIRKDREHAFPEDAAEPQRIAPMHDSSRSDEAWVIADLVALVNELPDEREQKVRSIKARVDAGTYVIDSRRIAERILREL